MRKQLGWTAAAVISIGLGGLGAASAADLPLKARPAPVVEVYNWTSCYVGLNGGWKEGRFRNESASTPAGVATAPGFAATPFDADHINLDPLNVNSGAAGAQVGCRWENPSHWVFGVEGDFDWTDLHGTVVSRGVGSGASVFVPGDYFDNRARWESSVRGIIGRSFDKWLIYATGGLAMIDVQMTSNFIPTVANGIPFPPSTGSESKVLYGFTIGAGAAYAFARNWDVGAEYRYSQYNGDNFNLGSVAAVCFAAGNCFNTTATGHKDLTTNEVLLKLNYHFGPAAVVAKY
jgi:outer membrane immunogenic protein